MLKSQLNEVRKVAQVICFMNFDMKLSIVLSNILKLFYKQMTCALKTKIYIS